MKGRIKSFGQWVDPRDEKYLLKIPEAGFSPERNRQVIEDSIKKATLLRQKKWKIWEDKTRERANALASFFRYLDEGKGGTNPLNKYFSRKTRAYLRGEELVKSLQNEYYARNQLGQIIRYHATQ